jgi:2-polyprenyl-3-methyl-5-hydroxy-6-metoxy-1,4-benzoquinol methylase
VTVSPAEKIAQRFGSPWLRSYVRRKIQWDPVYAAARDTFAGSTLPILDVGCGVGLLALYLREMGFEQDLLGIDTDGEKIELAREISEQSPGLEFVHGDATRDLGHFSGNVALLDVLHYLTDEEQRRLLDECAKRVAPGGAMVIRDCIRDGTLRYRLTWLEESFARTIGWLRVPRLNFPTRETLTAPFEGFTAEITPLWGRTPYNNYLIVFRRPG